MAELCKQLLADVKNYLDITWDDNSVDTKIIGIIRRGMSYLDRISGVHNDYLTESLARSLLMDYCRYSNSNALEDFAGNFLHELNALQIDSEVKQHAQNKSASL